MRWRNVTYNALARCYLQRASAMLLTMYNALARRYAFANGPIRTPYKGSWDLIIFLKPKAPIHLHTEGILK